MSWELEELDVFFTFPVSEVGQLYHVDASSKIHHSGQYSKHTRVEAGTMVSLKTQIQLLVVELPTFFYAIQLGPCS